MEEITDKTAALDPGKFSLEFVHRLKGSPHGTVVGYLGDFLKGEKVRELYWRVLGFPVMSIDKVIQKGKVVDKPELKFLGAFGTFRGRPMIFVNPRQGEDDMVMTLLEEGAHAVRKTKGRSSADQDLSGITSENIKEVHDSLPEEVSAKRMVEYAMGLDESLGAKTAERLDEDIALGRWSILWAVWEGKVHTSQGTYPHAHWFRSLGIPDSGPEFDRVPRGRARVDAANKEVRLFTEAQPPSGRHQYDLTGNADFKFAPEPVVRELKRKYPALGKFTFVDMVQETLGRTAAKPKPVELTLIQDEKRQADEIFDVLNYCKLDGFGGKCGAAATAINNALFNGLGTIVLAFNKALMRRNGDFHGHAAVLYKNRLWDAEGEISREDLEAWGMLDPNDSDYADAYGEGWNEVLANEVEIKEYPDGITILSQYKPLVAEYEKRLRKVLALKSKTAAAFPTQSFPRLWHSGTMDPQNKGEGSMEGAGLSVTTHPEEWRQITPLGTTLWELAREGNKFLDFHRLTYWQKKAIEKWGVANGYLDRRQLWRVEWGDEGGGTRWSDYEDREEAEFEMEQGSMGAKAKPKRRPGVVPTDRLKEETMNPRAESIIAMDLLATIYADQVLHLDGVWWGDTLDPSSMSAPRGVIFTSRLPSWTKRRVSRADMPKTAAWAGATDFSSDPKWHDLFHQDPTPEGIKALASFLKSDPNRFITLYHGTASELPVMEEGLLPTSPNRAKSYQSTPGYVYLSVYPNNAKDFGTLAYPGKETTVYAVNVTVRRLLPDTDQLANQRSVGKEVGNSLAESLAIGHGARVKGAVGPMQLYKTADLPKRPGLVGPLFHGTSKEFDEFKLPEDIGKYQVLSGLGIHFGNPRQAAECAGGQCGNIRPVYLDIKRPLRMPDQMDWHPDGVAYELLKRKLIDRGKMDELKALLHPPDKGYSGEVDHATGNRLLRKWIEEAGYDSVVYRNTYEGSGDSYIVWHPEQIKPALTAAISSRPSGTQDKVLGGMVAGNGNIRRIPGGFWVTEEPASVNDNGAPPGLWCDVRTVRALEKKGLVERVHAFPEEWRDTRRITDAGRGVLRKDTLDPVVGSVNYHLAGMGEDDRWVVPKYD